MGFYHGSGQSPRDPEGPASFREAMLITWVVITVLAKPLGILFGGIAYLVLTFVLFSVHPAVGGLALAAPFVALAIWAFWEWKHPPEAP